MRGYLGVVEYMVDAFGHYWDPTDIKSKKIVVMGSVSPWVESVILASGAEHVSTMDYMPIVSHDSRISILNMQEMMR